MQLQKSEYQSVRGNIPELYTGREWAVAVEASNTDSRIKITKVMENTQIGRTGLGYKKGGRGLIMRSSRIVGNFWK